MSSSLYDEIAHALSEGKELDHKLIRELALKATGIDLGEAPLEALPVDETMAEIVQRDELPLGEIGRIWYTEKDDHVCPKCQYLNGRWFDTKDAHMIASLMGCGCRCSAQFDLGTPERAIVGPVPGYRPGTGEAIYHKLDELIAERNQRAQEMIDAASQKPSRGEGK